MLPMGGKKRDVETKVKKHLDAIMAIDGGWDELLDIVWRRGIQRTLREARIAKGMKQSDLAAKMDITQNAVSQLERGRYPDYQLSTLRRWALALDLRYEWIITEIPTGDEDDVDPKSEPTEPM